MEKTAEIRQKFSECGIAGLPQLIASYEGDARSGVQAAVASARKRIESYEREVRRTEEMKRYERQYDAYSYICGIDEVGRGPLAGPVVAGAVILPKNCSLLYLNDSKKLSEKKREELYDEIMEIALAVGIGFNTPARIDEINILQATYEAMREAASIVAKVTRDRLMVRYDEVYPEYGFASHKGYGSAMHIEAIRKYGPTPIHRKSFIKNL